MSSPPQIVINVEGGSDNGEGTVPSAPEPSPRHGSSGPPSPASSASTLVDLDDVPLDDEGHDEGHDEVDLKRDAACNAPSVRSSIQASILDSIDRFSKRYSFRKPRSWSSVSRFSLRDPGFGLVNLLALKVLFVDAAVSVGDVASDFAQGAALLSTEGLEVFGLVTLAVNWLPGLVAAVHLFSMYRTKHHCKWIFLWAILLLLFYPVVPLLAYLNLLWRHPKSRSRLPADRQDFREAEYLAAIAHSIAGGIESPIQFILQMWLILNGKIPRPWDERSQLTLRDWHGNELHLPTTAAISLAFSLASIAKAVVDFNIVRVHIEDISSGRKLLHSLCLILEHLPFLAAAAFFRIATIVILLTYLNAFTFLPAAVFWFVCLAIGYRSFNLEKIPLWLISFISLFFPICFTTHQVTPKNRPKMVRLQYKTFLHQSVCAAVLYLPALLFCFYKVNFDAGWAYDANVVMDNLEFNVAVAVVSAMGVLAALLSARPNWTHWCRFKWPSLSCTSIRTADVFDSAPFRKRKVVTIAATKSSGSFPAPLKKDASTSSDFGRAPTGNSVSKSEWAATLCRTAAGVLVLMLVLAPAVAPIVALQLWRTQEAYVAFSPAKSHTRIIKAVPLTHSWKSGLLKGCFAAYDLKTREAEEFQYPVCSSGKLLRVEREDWPICVESGCHASASAVVIVDGRPPPTLASRSDAAPAAARMNVFRPSFPTSDIKRVEGLPMVLVQSVDADWLFPSAPSCLTKPCDVVVARTQRDIPTTEFECDASSEKQLPYDEDEPLIDPATRHVRGRQFRSVLCHWGGERCLGWRRHRLDARGREWRDYCDGPAIANFFRRNGFEWNFDHPLRIRGRIFHARGSTSKYNPCLTSHHVSLCDSCESGASAGAASSGWSKWLRCDRTDPDNLIRKRFCQVSKGCLIQEKRTRLTEQECQMENLPNV